MKIKLKRDVVAKLALEHGFSMSELQRQANISNYTMYNAMKKESGVQASTAKKIADALGVNVMELAIIENEEPAEKGA